MARDPRSEGEECGHTLCQQDLRSTRHGHHPIQHLIKWSMFNPIYPGIGVPGVSSTDTNNPLFLGGHPRFRQTHTGSTQSHHLFQSLVSLHSFNSKSTFFLNSFSRPGKFSIRGDQVNYSGCMKEVVIEGKPVEMTADRLIGDIHSHVCPTI